MMHGRGCSRACHTVSDLIQAGSADLLVLIGGQTDTPRPAARVSPIDASHGRLPALPVDAVPLRPCGAVAGFHDAFGTSEVDLRCITRMIEQLHAVLTARCLPAAATESFRSAAGNEVGPAGARITTYNCKPEAW